jgi:hypothetical protein
MDREDIADNLVRRWKDEVRGALEVSVNIVSKIEEVYQIAMVEEDEQSTIDVESALKSTAYRGYLIAASELEKVNINELSQKERISFFLNVYQCMYIHHLLRMVYEGRTGTESYFNQIKSLVWDYSSKPFYYNIGGLNFNLDEVKHGVLRGNKKNPHAYLRSLGRSDDRASIIKDLNDSRINFVCIDFPELVEHIDAFDSEETLNEKLDAFVSEILNAKVNIDTMQGEIVLPKLLHNYKDDFGSYDEHILRFVFRYYQSEDLDEDSAIREVCHKKSMMIRYE